MNNKKIQELLKQGLNYSQIGKLYGVSRQRIHQIAKNYTTIYLKSLKNNIFRRDKHTCQWKEKCNGEQENLIIHHIDLNSKNNLESNLITLCKDCHVWFHKLEHEERLTKYTCIYCKEKFNKENGNAWTIIKACSKCIQKNEQERIFKKHNRRCTDCNELIPPKFNKLSRCSKCYQRLKLLDPEIRARHRKLTDNWRKNNKERAKEIQSKASKKYNSKPEIKQKIKDYYTNWIIKLKKDPVKYSQYIEKQRERQRKYEIKKLSPV